MGDGPVKDRRAKFDFEVDSSNGGGLQGQGFRLDIEGEDISDEELARYLERLTKPVGMQSACASLAGSLFSVCGEVKILAPTVGPHAQLLPE